MRFIIAALLILTMAGGALAQYGTAYVTYDVAFPIGETNDFIREKSWRGVGIGVSKFVMSPNLDIGVSWQWNTLQETTRDPIEMGDLAVSGDQVRKIYISPILVTGNYHFSAVREQYPFEPFVGLGAGAYYIEKSLDIGITSLEEKNWHFGIEPRAGVTVPVYNNIEAVLVASYHYILEAGNGTDHSFFDIGIGLAYRR